jgi:hypothetical protein
MHLFDLLRMKEPSFDPSKAKVHLARWNKIDHPIEVYRRSEFDEWQRWQNGHNFNCPVVVSLIQDGSSTRWMFAGLFKPVGHTIEAGPKRDHYYYDLHWTRWQQGPGQGTGIEGQRAAARLAVLALGDCGPAIRAWRG